MRYSYEYKRKCVELYRKGKWPDFPEGISKEAFKKQYGVGFEAKMVLGQKVYIIKIGIEFGHQKKNLNLYLK